MSHRYVGGLITKSPVTPTAAAAPGVWTLEQALQYIKAGTWPSPQLGDPYWEYTNLLLGTTATNGAQNNTFLDSSANAYSVTRSGNPTQGTFTPFSVPEGYWGNYFDGTGDYLSTPDSSAFDLGTSDFTYEFWLFPTSNSSIQYVFGQADSGTSGGTVSSFFYRNTDGTVAGRIQATSGTNYGNATSVAAPINVWTHIAFVRDGNTMRVYLNGTQAATTDVTGITVNNSSNQFAIGRVGEYNGFYYAGFISNFRYVKGTCVYPNGTTFIPSTTPLTAITNTQLLTCQSNRFIDTNTQTAAKTLTPNGNLKVLPFAPFGNPSSYRTNAVSGSGYFDGSGDYLTTGYTGFFGTGDYTFSFWIYMDAYVSPDNNGSDGGFVYIYNQGASHPTYPLGLTISKAGKVVVVDSVNFGPTWESTFDYAGSYNTANSLKLGQWNYVHVYRQSGTLYIYNNGGLQLSVAQPSSPAAPVTNGTLIPQGYCQGYITDFRFTTSAITDPTPPTAPLTAVTNTQLLLNFTNAGIYDNAAKNDIETAGNTQVSTSVVKYGAGSTYFDGNGDYMTIPYSQNFNFGTGDFTVECWANITYVQYTAIITSTPVSITSNHWLLGYSNTAYQMAFGIDSSGNATIGADYTRFVNTWTHIAVSRTGGVLKMFFNGLQVASVANSSNFIGDSANPVALGRRYTDNAAYSLNGYISDLRITKGYSRYNYNFTPPAASLPTYYQLLTPTSDPYFEYTTLLLPGNGTNGAQNNTFLDSSANAFSITRNGNTTQGTFSPFSQTGWSNYFGGTNYLTIADDAGLDLGTDNFTIHVWIYPTWSSPGPNEPIVAKGNSSATGTWQIDVQSSSVVRFAWNSGSSIASTGTITPNQWTHIAVVREGTGTNQTKIYINGINDGTGTVSQDLTDTGLLKISRNRDNSTIFDGYVSSLAIVRSAIWTTNFSPPTAPPTDDANTELLTCQSNRFVDNSSNDYAITVTGTPSVQPFSPFAPSAAYSPSVNGGSGYFDGSGDWLRVANDSAFDMGSGDFTIEGWFYQTTASGNQGICSKYEASYQNSWYIGTNGSNWDVYTYYGSTSNLTVYTGAAPALNQWNHFALERNGANIEFYVNGSRLAQVGAQTMRTSTAGVAIGAGGTGYVTNYEFDGYISNLRIIKGTAVYSGSTYTVPTSPATAVSGTSLLCNFTNAGITDAAAKNDLETVGNAQISTAQSKFGGSSMYFDGTGDYLVTPSKATTTLEGDFTIEGWAYVSSGAVAWPLVNYGDCNTSTGFEFYRRSSNGKWAVFSNGSVVLEGSTVQSTGVWVHIAIVRYSGNVKLYVNGLNEGSAWSTTTTFSGTVYVGGEFYSGSITATANGYIDDLRITKGIARYTQNFEPPTAAFLTL